MSRSSGIEVLLPEMEHVGKWNTVDFVYWMDECSNETSYKKQQPYMELLSQFSFAKPPPPKKKKTLLNSQTDRISYEGPPQTPLPQGQPWPAGWKERRFRRRGEPTREDKYFYPPLDGDSAESRDDNIDDAVEEEDSSPIKMRSVNEVFRYIAAYKKTQDPALALADALTGNARKAALAKFKVKTKPNNQSNKNKKNMKSKLKALKPTKSSPVKKTTKTKIKTSPFTPLSLQETKPSPLKRTKQKESPSRIMKHEEEVKSIQTKQKETELAPSKTSNEMKTCGDLREETNRTVDRATRGMMAEKTANESTETKIETKRAAIKATEVETQKRRTYKRAAEPWRKATRKPSIPMGQGSPSPTGPHNPNRVERLAKVTKSLNATISVETASRQGWHVYFDPFPVQTFPPDLTEDDVLIGQFLMNTTHPGTVQYNLMLYRQLFSTKEKTSHAVAVDIIKYVKSCGDRKFYHFDSSMVWSVPASGSPIVWKAVTDQDILIEKIRRTFENMKLRHKQQHAWLFDADGVAASDNVETEAAHTKKQAHRDTTEQKASSMVAATNHARALHAGTLRPYSESERSHLGTFRNQTHPNRVAEKKRMALPSHPLLVSPLQRPAFKNASGNSRPRPAHSAQQTRGGRIDPVNTTIREQPAANGVRRLDFEVVKNPSPKAKQESLGHREKTVPAADGHGLLQGNKKLQTKGALGAHTGNDQFQTMLQFTEVRPLGKSRSAMAAGTLHSSNLRKEATALQQDFTQARTPSGYLSIAPNPSCGSVTQPYDERAKLKHRPKFPYGYKKRSENLMRQPNMDSPLDAQTRSQVYEGLG